VAPAGAAQCAASRLILHFVPVVFVTQHVTAPARLPHVERAAHLFTNGAQVWFTRTLFA
jgi:hypothetical protein